MKLYRTLFLLVLVFTAGYAHAQKNGLGLYAGYMHMNAPGWNTLFDAYNANDTVTSKQPYFAHVPYTGLVYERKVSEYLYGQVHLGYGVVQSKSKQNGDLLFKMQLPSVGIAVNWYPAKMINGMKATALNPLFLQFRINGVYALKSLTLNGATAYEADTFETVKSGSIGLFGGLGLGYDLHFGRRLIVQTVFDVSVSPGMDLEELNYFIPKAEYNGYETTSRIFTLGGRINLIIPFNIKFPKRKNDQDKMF